MTIEQLHQIYTQSSGICTDTRKIQQNQLFFALRGPNFNANEFAVKAIEQGASYAVIDDKNFETDKTILVEDALQCLQDLARYHRQLLSYPIIGLTGSNGKTTTKELIHSVLSQSYRVQSTKGNLNNHIGVALSVLDFDLDLDFGIVEMGANHQKEIAFLCSISQPDYGLITNFGKAHLEGFGGVEGVIKGKSELYDFLRQQDRTAFINAGDPKQVQQIGNYSKTILFGDAAKVDYPVEFISSDPFVQVVFKGLRIESHLIGAYNFANIAVAIAIGAHFKMKPSDIKAGIENYRPDNNRSEILIKGSNRLIMDAYNANPTSMMAALKNFEKLKAKKKYLFLGDMFELGEDAATEHQSIADFVEAHFDGPIYLIGENFYKTSTSPKSTKFKSFEEARQVFNGLSISEADIIVKGSRGMALERILELVTFR
jgi:UDP-N-acetylmuramoyl-tripeptide--D-alanyl-D-alanine ligase